MKALTLAVALAALSTPVLAGGPTVVEPDPMPDAMAAPVAAHDWSGAYVGLGYGKVSGHVGYSNGFSRDMEDGKLRSIYGGYQMQRGNLVFGGELAFSNTSDFTLIGFPLESIERMIDLKGKIGFATNRVLFYGALGVTKVDYKFVVAPAQNYTADGVAYGVGVDFAVTERLSMGLEYLARKTDSPIPATPLTSDLDVNSVSLRVGLSF
jgi:outer membrane immunogenic protein